MDTSHLRDACLQLSHRLEGMPEWPELRAIYLELTTLVGQIQGAVAESTRHADGPSPSGAIEEKLVQLKSSVRQVGVDIRLASPAALNLGLQSGVQQAKEVLDLLARQ